MQLHLYNTWHIQAPLETVWATVVNQQAWPKWWKVVKEVDLLSKGIHYGEKGYKTKTRLQGFIPYSVTFSTEVIVVKPLTYSKGIIRGDLLGNDLWQFSQKRTNTTVSYTLDITPTVPWMNTFSLFVKPILFFSHQIFMHEGEKGLSQFLQTEHIAHKK